MNDTFLFAAFSLFLTIIQTLETVRRVIGESLTSLLNTGLEHLPFLIAGTIVLFFFWLLSIVVRWIFLTATRKANVDIRVRLLISRLIVALVILIGIFTSLSVIIPSFNVGNLIAGLGFTSFIIGFAAKDIVNNFISGILILWQRPFQIGDHILVGGNHGDVEFIGVRTTNLRKEDGELLLIPNGEM